MVLLLQQSGREELRARFPDTCFAVAEQIGTTIQSARSVIATWENKVTENPGIEQICKKEGIGILDLKALSQGKIEYLLNGGTSLVNPILVSDGVIPLMNWKGLLVTPVTQRDSGGNADNGLYTGVAGRAEGAVNGLNLSRESLREWLEEGAYLGSKNGEFYLLLPQAGKSLGNVGEEISGFIGIDNANGVRSYLGKKYKAHGEADFDNAKKTFETNFPNLRYDDFEILLREIYKAGRILFYQTKSVAEGYGITTIDIDGKNISGFNWFDSSSNTLEHRQIYNVDLSCIFDAVGNRIEGVDILGNGHPQSLYLESLHQGSRSIGLTENVLTTQVDNKIQYYVNDITGRSTQLVPTTAEFIRQQNS